MTQKEMAAALGVSQSTVSLALAGSPRICEEVRRRVLALAREGAYSPNLNARALQARRSGLVGVLFPEFSQAYYDELKKELHPLLKERGYTGLFFTAGDGGDTEQLVAELCGRGVEGLIVAPNSCCERLKALAEAKFPLVAYRKPGDLRCSSVGTDGLDAGAQAARHLLSLGHRSFACLGAGRPPYDERFRGFLKALSDAGVKVSDEMIPEVRAGMASGCEAMAALLAKGLRPDAVFCFNDSTALGAMRAAKDAGLSLPDELAFMGYDDIEEARYSIPSLSSVAQPRSETARQLVSLLMERISDPSETCRRVVLKARLAIRESCGAKLLRGKFNQ